MDTSLIYTIPALEEIQAFVAPVPGFMFPNTSPYGVVWEAALSDEECDAILEEFLTIPTHQFPYCTAVTREWDRTRGEAKSLIPVIEFGVLANSEFWEYDIQTSHAWLQTYFSGNDYALHFDGSIGQTRKLTVVVMLSEQTNYEGGQLEMNFPTETFHIPKTRGTMCIFPFWVPHNVSMVTKGMRQTINLGFWGPPFK